MSRGCFRISDRKATSLLTPLLRGMPAFNGEPILVSFLPELTAHRGKLLSGAGRGLPVHAGAHLRRREMVLETNLLGNPGELVRIFVHEVHHYVWARLGKARRGYEQLLHREMESNARGELGWPSLSLKQNLTPEDRRKRTQRWRDYVCESFCDTAAWMYSRSRSHAEWTLAASHRKKRAKYLSPIIEEGELRV